MSLATASLMETVKKQYFFKLKANIDSFSSLVGIQLIAILFSMGGSASSGTFSDGVSITLKHYSADIVIVFTMIWAFVTAITITTKPYRSRDFTFVTNRLSSGLSNVLFLFTASLMGGVLAILSRSLILVIGSLIFEEKFYAVPFPVGEMILAIAMSVLYIFGISSVGYFIGALVQTNKIFAVVIPTLIVGSMFVEASMNTEPSIVKAFQFYIFESSVLLFTFKIVVTTALLFIAAISILNRMEVRR